MLYDFVCFCFPTAGYFFLSREVRQFFCFSSQPLGEQKHAGSIDLEWLEDWNWKISAAFRNHLKLEEFQVPVAAWGTMMGISPFLRLIPIHPLEIPTPSPYQNQIATLMWWSLYNEGPQPRSQKCLFLRPQKQAPCRARLPELGFCSQDSMRWAETSAAWDWRPRVAGARMVLAETLP